MKKRISFKEHLARQNGAVLIVVALLLLVFVGMAAMAVDLGYLFVVRNQLQNAADAGVLAGAAELYFREETAPSPADVGRVNPGANGVARDTARQNRSEQVAVEVAPGEVERGHWSFASRTFAPNTSLEPVTLAGRSTAELDADPNFINAVRVVVRRRDVPVSSFFARIFGYQDFALSARAVGYVGYAGTLHPFEVDQPIAICRQAIEDEDGRMTCVTGRMLSSGDVGEALVNTAGWTDFDQEPANCGAPGASSIRDLVCGGGNPDPILFGEPLAATGGVAETIFKRLRDCWEGQSDNRTRPWPMVLPVIDCPDPNVHSCATVVGAVAVDLLWMSRGEGQPKPEDAPLAMASPDPERVGDWNYAATDQCLDFKGLVGREFQDGKNSSFLENALKDLGFDPSPWAKSKTYTEGMARWDCFVKHFQLRDAAGNLAPMLMKSLYFTPDCQSREPTGATGGENFGIQAQTPVLVD